MRDSLVNPPHLKSKIKTMAYYPPNSWINMIRNYQIMAKRTVRIPRLRFSRTIRGIPVELARNMAKDRTIIITTIKIAKIKTSDLITLISRKLVAVVCPVLSYSHRRLSNTNTNSSNTTRNPLIASPKSLDSNKMIAAL